MTAFWPMVVLLGGGLEGVRGADKAAELPVAAKAALAKDGFAVVEGRERHFFSLYDRNAYEKVPSFISADVVLHVMHTRFDDELTAHELRRLVPALKDFASGQLARALTFWPAQGSPDPAIESLALFHAVALVLLDENAALDPRIAAAAKADARVLRGATGELRSKACGLPFDASLLLPRGHYDRLELRGYFQASSWYAQCVFRLDRDGLARAVNVVRLIDPKSAAALHQLEAARSFIAGPADDPGVGELEPLLAGLPPLPQPVPNLDAILSKLSTTPRVASRRGAVFALLGGARTLDAEVLGLSAAKTRTPSALDVLAALGSPSALRLLGRPAAPPSLPRGGGLSQRWLDVLTLLVGAAPQGQPPYALTSAWEGRVLTSAAASWAELEHDTLLYVKQPVVMREGGHDAELPAAKVGGYVDPRPDVYREVLAMRDALRGRTNHRSPRAQSRGHLLIRAASAAGHRCGCPLRAALVGRVSDRAVFVCHHGSMSAKVVEPVKEKLFVKELVEKDYEAEVLNAPEPVALDFYSADSAPCAALAPRFGAVAEKFDGKIRFFKILRDSNEALAKKLNVTASPTLVFFKTGKELGERLTGDDIKRTSLKASVEALLK